MSADTRQATGLTVRPATPDDVPAVRAFMLGIFELALALDQGHAQPGRTI